jgi:predicted amidohydrolase YtcJ
VRAVKAYSDGALGSRGAWMLDAYADDPGNSGHNTVPLEDIEAVTRLALEHGYQVCTHAIGDRANREVLDLYEAVLGAEPEAAEDIRFRIEHSQILHPDDVPRFAELGVIAAMQGIHAISDGPWTPERIGEERTRERAYQFRDLIDSGATVMNGTDAPVEDVNPIPSYYGTIAGRMNNGEVLNPDELMTRMEGLKAYTINAAYGAHEEGIKGSISVGKLADIVVLSTDILTVPEDQILDARADLTIVGGEIVYTRSGD